MPGIEYNTFHPTADEDSEGGTLLPFSSGTTAGDVEVGMMARVFLTTSKLKNKWSVAAGLMMMMIFAAAFSKNLRSPLRAKELPMLQNSFDFYHHPSNDNSFDFYVFSSKFLFSNIVQCK